MFKFEGSKYRETQNFSFIEIAKRIRQELKQIENVKLSVKTSRGRSLVISIKNIPFNPYSQKYIETNILSKNWEKWRNRDSEVHKYTKQYTELITRIRDIVNQYNMDDSEIMTDYFHVGFYFEISLNWNYIKEIERSIFTKEGLK